MHLYNVPDNNYRSPSPFLTDERKREIDLGLLSYRTQVKKPLKIYALNGFLYPLPIEGVEHVWRWNWNDRRAEQFAKTITEECILIGFSDGAHAALTVAQNSDYVKKVYCHSCLYSKYPLKRKFDVAFFATFDDTLIKGDTDRTFLRYIANGYNCYIKDLEPKPIGGFNPTHRFMDWHNHHFLNALPYLPVMGKT